MLRSLKYSLFFFITFFAACTITEETYFKNDYSGTYTIKVDFTNTPKEYPQIKFENIKKGLKKEKLDSIINEVRKIDTLGFSNFQFGWIDSSMTFFYGFDFDNLFVLNELLISSYLNKRESLTREDLGDFQFFELKGKKTLVYNFFVEDSLDQQFDIQKKIKMNLIFKFDKKIRKVDNPKVKLSNNKKKAILRTNAYKINHPDFKKTIKFKFE